ncbi:hypothetical protein HYC85_001488 [Camellia sinensis]|uniref:PH domain-containing protein n=1 Tax=Camellia sinensis TaxID=4442 RepID=A0A7J7I5T2_CAMSI|nr:hypothetical protein HYC85_001488 [Camellia sinensis]
MDDTGTTSSHKKGKLRRFWNNRNEVFLITTMKDDDEQMMVPVDSDDVWLNYVKDIHMTLSQQRRLVNAELLKLPMSNTQRLMAASIIVKDEDKVDLFFSLDENDKMEWVSLLLKGHI